MTTKWFNEDGSRMACAEETCDSPVHVSGLCRAHYLRAYKNHQHPASVNWTNPDGSRMQCSLGGCYEDVKAKGVCAKHYQSERSKDKPRKARKPPKTKWFNDDGSRMTCTVEGCPNPINSKGLCVGHYSASRYVPVENPSVTGGRNLEMVACPVEGCDNFRSPRAELCSRCNQFKWRYSLTVPQALEFLKPENRHCSNPGCKNTENLHLDHDHACCPSGIFATTSRVSCGDCVRGWLCRSCNTSLGMMQENPRRIEGLLRYLEYTKR